MASRRKNPSKISKAQGYLVRLFAVEYDLDGMIKAYGPDFVKLLVDQIVAGKIDCRQCVDRWAADVSLFGSSIEPQTWFAAHQQEFTYSDEECLQLLAETA